MNGYNGYFDEIMDFFELSADFRRKAQILQLTDGGLDAVVTAVDGYGFSGQVHLEFLLGGPLLSPMFAGAAMSLSSVCVVGNALRLGRAKL